MDLLLPFLPHVSISDLFSRSLTRLLLAAVLGGIVGMEREFKRKPAGLRTNMFICFGSAMFTILSTELAGAWGTGDHTRIAAQIIPGIGFIGAGSILHAKGAVSGLTTAATLFVVASIGMASGGGLYLLAIFATMLLFLALHVLGWMERRLNLKPLMMNYVIESEEPADDLVTDVNAILEDHGKEMQDTRLSRSGTMQRLMFTVEGTRSEHQALMDRLRKAPELKTLKTTEGLEAE